MQTHLMSSFLLATFPKLFQWLAGTAVVYYQNICENLIIYLDLNTCRVQLSL